MARRPASPSIDDGLGDVGRYSLVYYFAGANV